MNEKVERLNKAYDALHSYLENPQNPDSGGPALLKLVDEMYAALACPICCTSDELV